MENKILAISAIIISVCALFVSLYEAVLMRKAQKAAAWPFVECLFSYDDSFLQMEITNSGLGPAKLSYLHITVEEKEFYENGFRKELPKITGPETDIFWSSVEGRVLSPGQTIHFFVIRDSTAVATMKRLLDNFDFDLCYCSVFDDCWISRGLVVEPCDSCELL